MIGGNGVMVLLLRENGNSTHMGNYRHIPLLLSICEIWATIVNDRLFLVLNFLTSEHHCAYKSQIHNWHNICNKAAISTQQIKCHVLLELSKYFDGIQGDILSRMRYGKGLHNNLFGIIILWRADANFCARQCGKLGDFVNNNAGAFQGSPLSAQLCIIYADCAMVIYANDIYNAYVSTARNIIRGDGDERSRANHILKLKTENAERLLRHGHSAAPTSVNNLT